MEGQITLEYIKNNVEEFFSVDLLCKSNKREFLYPRVIFSYIARTYTKKSYEEIGRFINKNHASILNNVKTSIYYIDYKGSIYQKFLDNWHEENKRPETQEEELIRLRSENEILKEEIKHLKRIL